PEEILSSADASRRDFLKKVLAGTTFAAPVIASFSMEGLSPGNVWAQTCNQTSVPNATNEFSFCANMTTSPCCRFAAEIAVAIWSLGTEFIFVPRIIKFQPLPPFPVPLFEPTVEVQALLLGGLAKALKAMTDGIAIGCTNKPGGNQGDQGEDEQATAV